MLSDWHSWPTTVPTRSPKLDYSVYYIRIIDVLRKKTVSTNLRTANDVWMENVWVYMLPACEEFWPCEEVKVSFQDAQAPLGGVWVAMAHDTHDWLDHMSKLDFRKGLLVPKKQTSFMRTFMNMLLCITLKLLMQIILQIAWNCQHTAAVAHVRPRGKIVCCRARQMQKMCRTRCMT